MPHIAAPETTGWEGREARPCLRMEKLSRSQNRTFPLSPSALTVSLDGVVCPGALLADLLSWDRDMNPGPDSRSKYIANKKKKN